MSASLETVVANAQALTAQLAERAANTERRRSLDGQTFADIRQTIAPTERR